MSLESGALQTQATDFGVPGILDGQVTSIDVLDPTEGNEKTVLLEVDDPFDVQLSWQLSGAMTPALGGSWVVTLYSKNMDGVGTMEGAIAGPAVIPILGAPGPLVYQYTFNVSPPTPQVGLYKLTATINHAPGSNPAEVTEMFGYAESTPIDIRQTLAETN